MLFREKVIIMPRFDITVVEYDREYKYTLPWVVTLDNGHRNLEIHVKTKDKALDIADKFQTRAWIKSTGAYRFLRDAFKETI